MADTVNEYAAYAGEILARGPRCGCIDAQPLGESRWGIPEVAYAFSSYIGGLAQSEVEAIIRAAFDAWMAVCNLKFKQVANVAQANIDIGAARGSRANFDGPSGTLAWAYLPSGANFKGRLQVRFDLDEAWESSIRLLNVATHEFGHAIGLSHINQVRAQLMNPTYAAKIATPQSEDIRQIQTLYGKPASAPTTPTEPAKPATGVKAVKILLDNGTVLGSDKFTDLTNAISGNEYAF